MGSVEDSRTAFDSETFDRDGSFQIDKPIGSASISPCGRDIVLASWQGLDIIDLDSPYAPPRHLSHQTPWKVADVQWSPFAARDYWIVSTSNQKALVWNVGLASTRSSVEHILHGHKRAITDINFSPHYADILATCAVDSFVHCWDLRRPLKPAMTFCDWFAGATQVKWNRQDSHILASSHDKYLKIWDDRKGAQPLRTISAHSTKIYGVDWDRLDSTKLATCSLDQTIKVWNYKSEIPTPDETIRTPFPVWRARYTPFGSGLVALPQRDNFDLHLYNRPNFSEQQDHENASSIHHFSGHRDKVKEFLWRARGNVTNDADNRDFQLVSWGSDGLLRLHEVNEEVLGKVGYTKGMEVKRTMNFTRRGARYLSFRDEPVSNADDIFENQLFHPPPSSMNRMNGNRTPFSSGYGSEGFMSSVSTKRVAAKEMDPVSWMRGVKINKHASSPLSMGEKLPSMLPPDPKIIAPWDVFESLGEEISSSLDKFPKVHVESIDVQQRTITISLTGPLASNRVASQLDCRIDFPTSYPDQAGPSLTINRIIASKDGLADMISKEVPELIQGYLSAKRHSFEAVLQYLLGEQTLEESLKWLRQPCNDSAAGIAQDLGSSSDEDDDDIGGVDGPTRHYLDAGDSMTAVNNAQYNVPLPNSCGARFNPNGLLVCFFPPKVERDTTLFGQSIGINARVSSSSKDIFEGFGRLHTPYRQKRASAAFGKTTDDESDEDDFELSSSESSSSSTGQVLLNHPFLPTVPWNGFNSGILPEQAVDASQKSVGGTGQTAFASTTGSKANMIISIENCTSILPAKHELAQRYRVNSGYDTALHNALVARNCGFPDSAEIWTLCSLLIKPLATLPGIINEPREPCGDGSTTSLANDSAIDVSFDRDYRNFAQYQNDVRDPNSIMLKRWLIGNIFQRLEHSWDVQMLAMLTCVLDETQTSVPVSPASKPDQPIDDQRSQVTIQLASENDVQNRKKLEEESYSWKAELEKRFGHKKHTSKSISILPGNSKTVIASSSSPPGLKPSWNDHTSKLFHASGLSTSPEEHRGLRRTSSTLNTFAIPLPKPFQLSYSAASSPPNSHTRKKSSPTGSFSESTQSNGAWTPSQWLSKASFNLDDSRSTSSPPREQVWMDRAQNVQNASTAKFSYELKNQERFRRSETSVLDPRQKGRYHAWRTAYADILAAWDMPMERAEMLKYNHQFPSSPNHESLVFGVPDQTSLSKKPETLELSTHCPQCGTLRDVQDTSCRSCGSRQSSHSCTYCRTYIIGLSSPCLKCGHTMHLTCRSEVTESGIDECITGCGCECSEHQTIDIPAPGQDQSLPARKASDVRERSPTVTIVDNESQRSDNQEQGVPAYTSLARTLEKKRRESYNRGLRTTASQIWKGT